MLRTLKDLEGYAIGATDGPIGHVRDFYFDDATWVIRYLVVEAGHWLARRKVLIAPIATGRPNREAKAIPVLLTKDQVQQSPDIDTDKPVSRQHEMAYLSYYGYPYYWSESALWSEGMQPTMALPACEGIGSPSAERAEADNAFERAEDARHLHDDPHLRSCNEVTGYHVHATDGDIGHVDGFLVDEESWAIRYMIVNTSNWWVGHQVLMSPQWVQGVRWADSKVTVNLTRQAIKEAPPYDPAAPPDRPLEILIHTHYVRAGYWTDNRVYEPGEPRD